MRIVAIGDTHGDYRRLEIPSCDILIHAGDITRFGIVEELYDFNDWIRRLDIEHKVVIGGNHDKCVFELKHNIGVVLRCCTYLCDSSCVLGGVVFYGTPWQNSLPEWYGYASNLKEKLDNIPENVDVLVTHIPAYGHLDCVNSAHIGSIELDDTVRRIKPSYHIFGHIHEGYGISDNGYGTVDINASVMNRSYNMVNKPVVFDFERRFGTNG